MQLPIRHLDEAVEEIEDDDADDDPAQDDPDEATDPDTNDADGGDAATDDAATDDAGTDDDAGIDPGPAESSIDGELVVGGTTYTPEDALVCEDDDSFPLDVELEFQVFAQGPDGPGQLDVFITELGADVSWSGEEGIYGEGLGNSDVEFTGDRVAGTATVTDAIGFEDTLDISFDLEVPATTFPCR